MSDIFLSCSEKDKKIAKIISDHLEKEGLTTWYYYRDFIPGVKNLQSTGKEIDTCKAVIVLVSESSLNEDFVFPEILCAVEKNKNLLPVLIGISFDELKALKPKWINAFGYTVSIEWDSTNSFDILGKITHGLKKITILNNPLSERFQHSSNSLIDLNKAETLPTFFNISCPVDLAVFVDGFCLAEIRHADNSGDALVDTTDYDIKISPTTPFTFKGREFTVLLNASDFLIGKADGDDIFVGDSLSDDIVVSEFELLA
ncbi:toll/interleukin-1 receptor domain-containing protein, partial [Desulfobacula phenolica]